MALDLTTLESLAEKYATACSQDLEALLSTSGTNLTSVLEKYLSTVPPIEVITPKDKK